MSSIPKTMYSMLLAVLQLQENKVYHTGEMCVYIYIYLYIKYIDIVCVQCIYI